MNSTIFMPKCSSIMVLNPILAFESQDSTVGYGALIKNSTWSWVIYQIRHSTRRKKGVLTDMPISLTSWRRFCTRSASSSFLLPPIRTSLILLLPFLYSEWLRRSSSSALTCDLWSFSGLMLSDGYIPKFRDLPTWTARRSGQRAL